MDREQGTIARKMDKGYGFIAREGHDKDVFFHANELVNVEFDSLQEGDKVTFDLAQTPKGLNAVAVELAE